MKGAHDSVLTSLTALADFIAHNHGADALRSVVTFAVRHFGVDYAHIGRIDPKALEVEVLAGFSEAFTPEAGYRYALEGTPCAQVMHEAHQCIASGVRRLFPHDADLQMLGAEGYIGEPILDSGGVSIGLIVLVHSERIEESEMMRMGLRLLAAHVASQLRQIEDARTLERHRRLLFDVINQMPDVLVVKDVQGNFLLANEAVARLYQTTPEAMVGKNDGDFGVPQELSEAMRRNVLAIMAKGHGEVVYEESVDVKTGELRHFKSIKAPFDDADGQRQILVIAQDVTDLVRARRTIALQNTFLKTLIQTIPDLVWLKDPEGRYLACNPRFEALYGVREAELLGRIDYEFVDQETADFFRAHDRKAIENGASSVNEEWLYFASDGHREWTETTKTPMVDADGQLIGVLGIGHNITERKAYQRELERMAHYDALTGLPNRRLLEDRLQQAIASAQRQENMIAIVYLDLDGFKAVNDQFGHETGDKLLVTLSVRMRSLLREGDTLCRLGGDEFVAVLPGLPSRSSCDALLERLLDVSSTVVEIDGIALQVSISAGVAFYLPGVTLATPAQLIRQADQAMYTAKEAGKNRYHFYHAPS
ncbi:MAG: diguanylate cyclase [Campylobacterales bacterium]|nr:diguanylate cyclase [Campylobacterales bacterium]